MQVTCAGCLVRLTPMRLPGLVVRSVTWPCHAGTGRQLQRLCVASDYNGRSRQQRSRQQRPPGPPQFKQEDLAKYALPALGAVSAAMLVGPLIAGVFAFAFGTTMVLATSVAVLSLSWMLLPFFFGLVVLPFFFLGPLGIVGAAAGAVAIPLFAQLGVLAAALWAGRTVARFFFQDGSSSGSTANPDGTIDVEAGTVEDWSREADAEERRRKKELDDFDDLLRRREAFKRKDNTF